ncbi:SulP family inorganic anion transporter [Psychrobacter sp. FDAARGOS_221]|uniref:SulP family inorganic anion transporter n=1 Tax=Psychrobacter sp. FDAARGOS_221 TaxID=1975705 RepID=UPI000BB5351D|nr:SulP family inorganic anion transporter [Psychrobacter sp. FDAARGOS_221]PNK61883.1 SulP family inorganic anion transporter [Psychrobacter sp. FDAARGOS_221]
MSRSLSLLIPRWLTPYPAKSLPADVIAGLVVGVLVIPQSLGYAVLAGLPPVYGIYSSIVPVLAYAWIGSSNVQAVGAVAITAIMTAGGLHGLAEEGTTQYAMLASLLALMVGLILWGAGRLKLGWIMHFISRGVSAGFVSAAAVLIFISQTKYLTGINVSSNTLPNALNSLVTNAHTLHPPTLIIGGVTLALFLLNRYASKLLWQSWLPDSAAKWAGRLFPLIVVIIAIIASHLGNWSDYGIRVIGEIPYGLPQLTLPLLDSPSQIITLLPRAGLIALIAFVSSCSVASTYARMRGEKFEPNDELRGLGLANIAGGFSQSFPVAGGFSRTAINVDSGARTPLASIITVGVMIAALLVLNRSLAPLPYALLGAMIMASIISLIDLDTLKTALRTDRLDAMNYGATFLGVMIFGLNIGLVIGIITSFAGLIWQSSQPHIAVVGRLAGTEHFRNINRHDVITYDNLLIMRVDESLFFGNSESVHLQIQGALNRYPKATNLVLMMSAVNHIDLTAQEMLTMLNRELMAQQKRLHFSVIKGPVMDIIKSTPVITELSGRVFLSTVQAVELLTDDDPNNDQYPKIQTTEFV